MSPVKLSRRGFLTGLAGFAGATVFAGPMVARATLAPALEPPPAPPPEEICPELGGDLSFERYRVLGSTARIAPGASSTVVVYPRHGWFLVAGALFMVEPGRVFVERIQVGDVDQVRSPFDAAVLNDPGVFLPVDWMAITKKRPLVITASPVDRRKEEGLPLVLAGHHGGFRDCFLGVRRQGVSS